MAEFRVVNAKGIRRLLAAPGVDPERLHLHVSEIGPGERPHPPHTHPGLEAIYVLEGQGTVEVDGVPHDVGVNECILMDTTRQHGLVNTGSVRMRYLVIITP
jgi:mannose-6-phosphate isomerase-like protein (cupin superfamily)